MVQSPSWEANWFATSQEIPRILWNPKVHYRTHKPPPPVPILGQPNPVYIPTSHLLEIHPNIIHPFTPRSPQWSLSLRFPHQDPIHPPLHTHTRYMPSPSHVYKQEIVSCLSRTYFALVNIDWDPKNVSSFLMKRFIMEAWWWSCRVETCSQNIHNKIGVFDGEFILLYLGFSHV